MLSGRPDYVTLQVLFASSLFFFTTLSRFLNFELCRSVRPFSMLSGRPDYVTLQVFPLSDPDPACIERGRAGPRAGRKRDLRCIHYSTPSGSSPVRPRLTLFFFFIKLKPLRSDQLQTTHRSPSTCDRDSLQTSCDRPRVAHSLAVPTTSLSESSFASARPFLITTRAQ